MTVKPSNKDTLLLRNLSTTLVRELGNQVCEHAMLQAAAATLRPEGIYETERLHGRQDYSATDLRKRWMLLKSAARRQTFAVCHSARLFLESQGLEREELSDVLQNSERLGRQFGLLPDTGRRLHDEAFLDKIGATPNAHLFSYDPAAKELDFSEEAKVMLRGSYGSEVGCSAMNVFIDHGGEKRSLYDIFWRYFSHEYVQKHLLGDAPYEELEISRPSD